MSTHRRVLAVVAGIGLLVSVGLAPALAASGPSLAFFSGGHGASAHWSTQDLPAGQSQTIQLVNPLPTGETYTGATVNGVAGLTMSQITALSFMIDTNDYMGAGAPRFSVLLGDSVTLFPSAGDCPLTKNMGWQTADFIHACLIYGSTGGPTTWAGWSTALGDPTITALYIVQDEGPATAYLANVTVNTPIH